MNASSYFQPSKYDFTILHSNDSIWRMKEFHVHDFFEIYLSLTGDSVFFVEDKIYKIQKGDLFLFNSQDLHKVVVPPNVNYERYVIEFIPEYIEKLSTEQTDLLEYFTDRPRIYSHQMHLQPKQLETFIALFEQAIFHFNNPTYGTELRTKMVLAEILLQINELYRASNIKNNSFLNKDYQKVKPIINHINDNLAEDLSLHNLSSTFYISKQQLCQSFKKVTGFSVNEFIIHRRIMRAKELLKKDYTVSQVGEMVGYYNLSHFIRTFNKMVGISPKKYSQKFLSE